MTDRLRMSAFISIVCGYLSQRMHTAIISKMSKNVRASELNSGVSISFCDVCDYFFLCLKPSK